MMRVDEKRAIKIGEYILGDLTQQMHKAGLV